MARYKVIINTDNYKCKRCSKKNWEPGTMNDYMIAINGWHTIEHSLREVMWRLMMFKGNDFPQDEWEGNPNTQSGLSERYIKWRNKKCNTIRYMDKLCGFEREQMPSGYGFMQGYLNINSKIKTLKENGIVKISFKELYDSRQYDKCMNGCYMLIEKVS